MEPPRIIDPPRITRILLLPELILSVLLLIFSLLLFYPGMITNDSIQQLAQAMGGHYDDLHPPLMSFVWHMLLRFSEGPFPMLCLQNVCFFTGLYLWAVQIGSNRTSRILIIFFIAFWPPILTQLGVIWKDTAFSSSLLAATALLAAASTRRWLLIPALAAIFYAGGVRHNALSALFPLLVWAASLGFPDNTAKKKIFLIGAGFTLLFFFVEPLISFHVLKAHRGHLSQVIALHDLAGLSIHEKKSLFPPASLRPGVTVEQIYATYDPLQAGYLTPLVQLTTDPEGLRSLRQRWRNAVLAHPFVYLKLRWQAFKTLIGFQTERVSYPFEYRSWPNPWGIQFYPSKPFRLLYRFFFRIQDSWVFRGWIYLGLCLIGIGVSWRKQDPSHAGIAIGVSGLLYGLGYFFYALTPDFRYLYWTVLAGMISVLCGLKRT